MQCVVCGHSGSGSRERCPHCRPLQTADATGTDALAALSPEEQSMPTSTNHERATSSTKTDETAKAATTQGAASTLIEFPGVPPKPQWRKELSERVREIQQRRAVEAAREMGETIAAAEHSADASDATTSGATVAAAPTGETSNSSLGLVPPPPVAAQTNPVLERALKRIERARQSTPPPLPRASRGGAALAHRFAEENYQELNAPPALAPDLNAAALDVDSVSVEHVEPPVESTARHTSLSIVPPVVAPPAPVAAVEVEESRAAIHESQARPHRHLDEVADDAALSRLEAEMLAQVLATPPQAAPSVDDHAPVFKRFASGLIDLLVVAFASTPFAAIIELTNGNWSDVRVAASMGGIVVVLMFVYQMAATALAGHTWGMSLVSLRTVDIHTGLAPTTGQCIRRALVYLLSLVTLGPGLLYALFDAEGRTAHDHLSGTVVIAD